jgi:hypothetical protein
MSIAMVSLDNRESKSAHTKTIAAMKYFVLSALEGSWPKDSPLLVSTLANNLDGPTKVVLHAAIDELRESGVIELAYSEGWTVGVLLTTKDPACPELAYSRNTGGGEA